MTTIYTNEYNKQILYFKEGRIYVNSPMEAPKGVALQRGRDGGLYYDSGVGQKAFKPAFKDKEAQKIYAQAKGTGVDEWEAQQQAQDYVQTKRDMKKKVRSVGFTKLRDFVNWYEGERKKGETIPEMGKQLGIDADKVVAYFNAAVDEVGERENREKLNP